MKSITAAEANRRFSWLLREVAHGSHYHITSHGKLVASMSPAQEEAASSPSARRARTRLLARLQRQKPSGTARTWTRDALYD